MFARHSRCAAGEEVIWRRRHTHPRYSTVQMANQPQPLKATVAQLHDDYGAAVLHAAWGDLGAPASSPALVFAWIELLPHEVPAPPDTQPNRVELGESAWVETGHYRLSISEVLRWYEECRTARIVKSPIGEQDLHLPTLGDEPPWPRFVLETKAVPFVPSWCASARTHHLIPVEEGANERLWPDVEARSAALARVGELMHFNFPDFPEYLGSIHLVAPNPVFREIHQRLRVGHDGHEDVLIRIDRRSGVDARPLELVVREERVLGTMAHFINSGADDELAVEFPGGVEALAMIARDQWRGALYSQAAYQFFRSFSMKMDLIGGSRTVQGSKDSYTVPTTSSEGQRVVTGTPRVSAAPAILRQAAAERETRHATASDKQFWIDDRDDAKSLLRGFIMQAQQDVFVVDAWFARADLFDFVLAARNDVSITILSSALGLQTEPGSFRFDPKKGSGHDLLSALRGLPSQGFQLPIAVRVMPGRKDKPPVHDRFLFVDSKCWALGGSLNHLGERASVVLQLPAPKEVRTRLNAIWEESQPLEEWLGTEGGQGEADK